MKYSLVLLLALASCASIIDGSTQKISLRTEPDQPATCEIKGESFATSAITPTQVAVHKSYHPLNIICISKVDGKTGSAKVLSDVGGWGYGGAVLTLGIGAGVDTYTGAGFEYPNDIVIPLGRSVTLGETNLNSNKEYK